MDLPLLLPAAAPWVGSFLGFAFSLLVIGGLAVLIHYAGVYYYLTKWAIKALGTYVSPR